MAKAQRGPDRMVLPVRYHTQLVFPVQLAATAVGALTAASVLGSGGAGVTVFSCVMLAFLAGVALVLIRSCLTVSKEGMTWRNGVFDRRSVSWSDVQSLEVGPAPGLAKWSMIVVTTPEGRFHIAPSGGSKARMAKTMSVLNMAWDDARRLSADQG